MRIRPATPADRPAVEAVVASAFDEPREGRVVQLLRRLDDSAATRADLVAVDADDAPDAPDVVGHVRLSRAWVDARSALVDVLVLSPLSVAPHRQGDGIGTRLVQAALEMAADLGAPAVFLEGGWDYYGKRGFQGAEPLGFERPSLRIPAPAFQVALLAAYQPWITGRLIYPEAFWSTDTVGLRDPDLHRIEQRAAGRA
jgi:putative acetyltransferase